MFVVCFGCVGVVVVVQMKTVEFRRKCTLEVRLQMRVYDVFDVEGNDMVMCEVIGVVLVVVQFVAVLVVVEVVAVVPGLSCCCCGGAT